LHFEWDAQPRPAESSARLDYFGNRVHYLTITEPHRELRLLTRSQVTVTPPAPPKTNASPTCGETREWLGNSTDASAHQARQFLFASPCVPDLPAVAEFSRRFFPAERAVLEGIAELNAAIRRQFVFDRTATTTATPLAEFFQFGRGVCQDFAHLAVASLRGAGLAARYVSGYLLTEPPPGYARLLGVDATHAWVSVFVPGIGWVDFDPTNNMLCAERHVTVARGRDYGDVSPVRGTVTGGGKHTLLLGVTVSPAGQ
jgi:transglutaminase-like putative cysteine protease